MGTRSRVTTSSICATRRWRARSNRASASCFFPTDMARTGQHSRWRHDMRHGSFTVFITGGTGLIGRAVIARLLRQHPDVRIAALVRNRERWRSLVTALGPLAARVVPVRGDITCDGLALATGAQHWLQRHSQVVVHLAADTVFSRTHDEARTVNVDGTRHVLEIANSWQGAERLVHVSTAFVAGGRNGLIAEQDNGADAGFVNPYEWSKY